MISKHYNQKEEEEEKEEAAAAARGGGGARRYLLSYLYVCMLFLRGEQPLGRGFPIVIATTGPQCRFGKLNMFWHRIFIKFNGLGCLQNASSSSSSLYFPFCETRAS